MRLVYFIVILFGIWVSPAGVQSSVLTFSHPLLFSSFHNVDILEYKGKLDFIF